jgi:hypothetical protein
MTSVAQPSGTVAHLRASSTRNFASALARRAMKRMSAAIICTALCNDTSGDGGTVLRRPGNTYCHGAVPASETTRSDDTSAIQSSRASGEPSCSTSTAWRNRSR